MLWRRVYVWTNDLLYNYALSHSTVYFQIVYALDFKAMEINTFVLIDHQLILLNNFIFDLTELVWTPQTV